MPPLDSPSPSASPSGSRHRELFTPAEESFHPLPYTPNPNPSSSRGKRPSGRPSLRFQEPVSSATLPADVVPDDPAAVFIRPPFNSFPDSARFNHTLTFKILAEHPNWFLVVSDFKSSDNPNPNAIGYPPELEPPRGWCANKKELQRRGLDRWPEGEEPRLRCTFCRRHYAGVNAKSMWRRHVYEKHKIAMSNRRDNNDPPKGRGSNKENKGTLVIKPHELPSGVPIPDSRGHPGNFTFLDESPDIVSRPAVSPAPSARDQQEPERDFDSDNEYDYHASSPPRTPPPVEQDPRDSPPSVMFTPYDPRRTPRFRHSPKRPALDQPWLHTSPSFPGYAARSRSLTSISLSEDDEGGTTSACSSTSDLSDLEPELHPPRRRPAQARRATDLFQVELGFAFAPYAGFDCVVDDVDDSGFPTSRLARKPERGSDLSEDENGSSPLLSMRKKRTYDWDTDPSEEGCLLEEIYDWGTPLRGPKRRRIET